MDSPPQDYVKLFSEQGYAVWPPADGLEALLNAATTAATTTMPLFPINSAATSEADITKTEGHFQVSDARSLFVYRLGAWALERAVASIPGASQRTAALSFVDSARKILEKMTEVGKYILSSLADAEDRMGAGDLMALQLLTGAGLQSGGGHDGTASLCSLTVQVDDASSKAAFTRDSHESVDCSYLTLMAVERDDGALQLYNRSTGKFVVPRIPDTIQAKWVIIAFAGHLLEVARGSPEAVRHRTNIATWKSRKVELSHKVAAAVGQKRSRATAEEAELQKRVCFIAKLLPHQNSELNIRRALAVRANVHSGNGGSAIDATSSFGPSRITKDEIRTFQERMSASAAVSSAAQAAPAAPPPPSSAGFQFYAVAPGHDELPISGRSHETFLAVLSRYWKISAEHWAVKFLGQEYELSALLSDAALIPGDCITLIRKPQQPASTAAPAPAPAPAPAAPAPPADDASFLFRVKYNGMNWAVTMKPSQTFFQAFSPHWPQLTGSELVAYNNVDISLHTTARDAGLLPDSQVEILEKPVAAAPDSSLGDQDPKPALNPAYALIAETDERTRKAQVNSMASAAVGSQKPKIRLTLRDSAQGTSIVVVAKPTTAFESIVQDYAKQVSQATKVGINKKGVRLFAGTARIRPHDCPRDHNLTESDVIDVFHAHANKNFPVKLRDGSGIETAFKLRHNAPLTELLDRYATQIGVDKSSLALYYQGERLTSKDTPYSLSLLDHDVIDIHLAKGGPLPAALASAPAPKPAAQPNGVCVTLRDSSTGYTVKMIARSGRPFLTLATEYVKRCPTPQDQPFWLAAIPEDVRFSFGSIRIRPNDTAQDRGIRDNDVIDVVNVQKAGLGHALSVRLRDDAGEETIYDLKARVSVFSDVLSDYARFKGLSEGSLSLFFQGRKIKPKDTPYILGMICDEIVDVHIGPGSPPTPTIVPAVLPKPISAPAPKPAAAAPPARQAATATAKGKRINLNLRDSVHGVKVQLSTDPNSTFETIARDYAQKHTKQHAQRLGVAVLAEHLRFSINSLRIRLHDTPAYHNLRSEALVDVVDVRQAGFSQGLTVRLRGSDDFETVCSVKPSTPFREMIEHFAAQRGVSEGSLRLTFAGRGIEPKDTPASLGMVNDEVIQVKVTAATAAASSAPTAAHAQKQAPPPKPALAPKPAVAPQASSAPKPAPAKPGRINFTFRDKVSGVSVMVQGDPKRPFWTVAEEYVHRLGGDAKLEFLRFSQYTVNYGKALNWRIRPNNILAHWGVKEDATIDVVDVRRTGNDKTLTLTVRDSEGGGEASYTVTPHTTIREVLDHAVPKLYPGISSYDALRITCDGPGVELTDTPYLLGSVDNEVLDTMRMSD